MFEKYDNNYTDLPDPYTGSDLQLATAFVDGLTPLNFYKPLQERLRELNARYMTNDKNKEGTDDIS